ncbi:hypothetical protein RFI_31452 [Reticulomyxa filosa]|uniref:Uncharacterized protein n=1 Tax=Reticulomyxa filosa TaxID=46433 RepID=X6LVK2_RETFI|nr:hypothetical protein RFI_31452 [Reticulomyxa filosa]|eukprot:ETO05943.1 hypothetical protein RFI_31452 [Reticulomyxa filosa]
MTSSALHYMDFFKQKETISLTSFNKNIRKQVHRTIKCNPFIDFDIKFNYFFISEEEETQIIVRHWIRILKIKLGWIPDFDELVVAYVMFFIYLFSFNLNQVLATDIFLLDIFCSSSKLTKTFSGHNDYVWSIDYSAFGCDKLLCSGSEDKTVRIWDVESGRQIKLFQGHSDPVYCVKFSPYHYHNRRCNVICSSAYDKTIRFWDIKGNRQLKMFNEHTNGVYGINFSPFSGGQYLCSGSVDKTIRLWDVETFKSLSVLNRHEYAVWCVEFSPLQSHNNSNKSNAIGLIGGNGYTICSGSDDRTIRIWDIETTKQLILFRGHTDCVRSVKYGSNELGINGGANTILSGSRDQSVCLWDIRSGKEIQMFNGHTSYVYAVEYSPFVVDNNEIGGISNVICSASYDNTIRFWDIRSNKYELHVVHGDKKKDCGILCLTFIQLEKDRNSNNCCGINLCYSSKNGPIHIWG